MISVQEALKILHTNIPVPRKKIVTIQQALGCYLSDNVIAPEPSPRYTNSAMDGFALCFEDCQKASKQNPVSLRIIGESQAGIPFNDEISSGTAIRISTGAMLPAGSDTVVRVEDTEENNDTVDVLAAPFLGKDVRRAGEEFGKGILLLPERRKLGARELALLASVGLYEVSVFDRPQVSLLVTGTELAKPDDLNILPHQIRDSNTIMLESSLEEAGALMRNSSHVTDSLKSTMEAVKEAVTHKDDIILCSGGVSVGQHDHVKDAALAAGFTELFWKIFQKPGKPLFVCKKNNTLLFGLPGNPVSAFMCFNNYVKPVVAELQGAESHVTSITAKTLTQVVNASKRTHFIRVNVEDKPHEITVIKEMAQQGSHMLSTIVHADGYIVLQPEETLNPGELTDVFLF